MNRPVRTALLVAVLVIAAGFAARWAYTTHQRLNAKSTLSWMRNLGTVCEGSRAGSLEALLEECRKMGVECASEDAWGHPFIVEKASLPGPSRCRIISTGRDGRRGSCCQRRVGWRWDEDAVWEGEFLQVWYYMSSGR